MIQIFLVAQQLYIPLRLYIYIFFFFFFLVRPWSVVCMLVEAVGGQWGAEGSQEGRGAPKPNQN